MAAAAKWSLAEVRKHEASGLPVTVEQIAKMLEISRKLLEVSAIDLEAEGYRFGRYTFADMQQDLDAGEPVPGIYWKLAGRP